MSIRADKVKGLLEKKIEAGMILAGVDITSPEYDKCIKWHNKSLSTIGSKELELCEKVIYDIIKASPVETLYYLGAKAEGISREAMVQQRMALASSISSRISEVLVVEEAK